MAQADFKLLWDNWSAFEYVYSNRKSKLGPEKAEKLFYAHTNFKFLNKISESQPVYVNVDETDSKLKADSQAEVTYYIDFLNALK